MTRILITRPWEDAEPLALRLRQLGHEVLIEPMLEIVFFDAPVMNLKQIQGLLFTSANGVRAFARLTEFRDIQAFAVGDATAVAAHAAGFSRVASAAGDVVALAQLVRARCQPAAGPLLHIAASVRAGDLSALLEQAGFAVWRQVLYEGRPAEALSAATVAALTGGRVETVLVFSPRTARALCRLVVEAGLADACRTVTAACLSTAVAEAAAAPPALSPAINWRRIQVAARPDQEALLALLAY